jgi:hypothetical protein
MSARLIVKQKRVLRRGRITKAGGSAVIDIFDDANIVQVTNKEFADAVFHIVPEGASIYGTAFKQPPDLAPNGVWFGGPIADRWLRRKSDFSRGDCNTFYVVSSFYPDKDGRVMRRKAQFAAAHVVTLDDLGGGASAKIPWARVVLPPSFIIETSPDNCQAGYILTEPVTDADRFNRSVDALIAQGLASPVDPGMKGVTRYVRFPQGINNKTKYSPAHVQVCRGWNPERRYTLQDIIDAYGLVLSPPAPARAVRDTVAISMADDAYVKCLSDLKLTLSNKPRSGGDFEMLDILCPWHEEHTDRVDVGAVYIIGGGFSCFHGHCIDRTFRDMKDRLRTAYGVDTRVLDNLNADQREQTKINNTAAYAARVIARGWKT